MKFAIYATSVEGCLEIFNFNTIEELMNFKNERGHSIIIEHNNAYQEDIDLVRKYNSRVSITELVTIPNAIEIYDDYRE